MAKKLSQMTWEDVQQEMSIAGSPEKIIAIGRDIEFIVGTRIDPTNRAELTNLEFMLRRLVAEARQLQQIYDKSH